MVALLKKTKKLSERRERERWEKRRGHTTFINYVCESNV